MITMADIPLRTYEKKIEDLIGQNLLQEAVVHCKHILGTFPKNISTYRILGQVFLEGKRYNEAADIFNRVLTVYPDDFISHVGMSIVRENANNLDAAIWHMELAFDNQPSNITIQEELKRLFGKRDGTHPAKIRLTRGALVRMYARGELYQQAITEIKSALTEGIKRHDLEVFLAKMYYLSGDQTAAMELCNKLIDDLPYCFEINKILAETSPNAQNIYMDRLRELDPYQAFINPKFPTVESVPDDKVTLEELTDITTIEMAKDSAWVNVLEDEWNKTPSVRLEEGIEQKPSAENPFEQPKIDSPFPFEAPGIETPGHAPLFEPEAETNIQSAVEGTKPEDWLRSIETNPSPAETPQEESAQPSSTEDLPDWLSSLAPEANSVEPESEKEAAFEKPFEGFEADQMRSADSEEPGGSQPEAETASGSDSDLPDWLKNFDTENSSEPVTKDDLPDWLNSLQAQEPGQSGKETPAFEFEPEKTTEEPAPALEEIKEEAFTQIPPLDEKLDAFTPISPLAEEQEEFSSPVESVEEPIETPEAPVAAEKSEGIPEWIRALQGDGAQEAAAEAETQPATIIDEIQQNESSSEPAATESLVSEAAGDELLAWLRDLKPEDNQSVLNEPESTEDVHINTESLGYDFESELKKLSQLDQQEPGEQAAIEETTEFVEQHPEQPIEATGTGESIPNPLEDFEFASANLEKPEEFEPSVEQPTEIPETPLVEETLKPAASENLYVESDVNVLSKMISSSADITPILQRLQTLSREQPEDYLTWQALGDAYAKSNQFSDALSAYNRAEKILISQK
jgi:tetratricopeptide (TPR) repeat protein